MICVAISVRSAMLRSNMKKSQLRYSRGYKLKKHSYQKRSLETGKFRKIVLIFTWVLFLILALSYVLFFSPIFEIKEIKISGDYTIEDEEIYNTLNDILDKKILIFFDHNNIFLIQKNSLFKTLNKNFPQILSIKMNKNIINKTLVLNIMERREVGIYCEGKFAPLEPQENESTALEYSQGECYYIDVNGVIFEKAPQTSGTLILVIKDLSLIDAKIGESIIGPELLTELINLRIYLSDQLSLKVVDFVIDSNILKEIRINTNEGWYLLLDPSRSLLEQAEDLRLALDEKIKDERSNLKYIDLRIENRVYYK